ncbi:MAG: hydrogenase subunit MbhD domain-containing protein [Geitlerinemataceae cyanobacterium]
MIESVSDLDVLAIVLLLPAAAIMTTLQKNPYHALVVRGLLGSVAALVYALLGAADVALTEALVGTMLAITLYAVAVRSSLVLRLGTIAEHPEDLPAEPDAAPESLGEPASAIPSELETDADLKPFLQDLYAFCQRHYLRLELMSFPDREALAAALRSREIHAASYRVPEADRAADSCTSDSCNYAIEVRVERLYELMRDELNPACVNLRAAPDSEAAASLPTPEPAPEPDTPAPPTTV